MDRIIRDFLERRPNGAIVQLGCGLETTYYRCDNGRARWYAVDLPHVIEYRRGLLPEPEREFYISGDAFVKDWIIKFAMMYQMPLFSLLQVDYCIILRKIRSFPFCV